jgi:hypothetical protein
MDAVQASLSSFYTYIYMYISYTKMSEALPIILFKSCFPSSTSRQGFIDLFSISGTLKIVKSVGSIVDRSYRLTAIDTVAKAEGLTEKTTVPAP